MLSSSRNEHPTHPLPVDQHLEDESGPREECGVFGVWAPGEDVAKLTYYGLYALQHRGQESAGIASADGAQMYCQARMVGWAFSQFDPPVVE